MRPICVSPFHACSYHLTPHSHSVRLGIEECSRQLREETYKRAKTESDGSISPDPIYDQRGVRTNTREVRKKRELEMRRHDNIQSLLKLDPNYRPPADYK